ncbi:MAG: hypothetical protein CMK59_00245 [Proteobacteria bacterium]|nr:hypothetical protein [Pseudomonadota bacterium]
MLQKIRAEERAILAVITAVLLICIPYVFGGEVWDDRPLFELLRGTSFLDLWIQPVGGGAVGQGYYRPFSMMVLKVLGDVTLIHVAAIVFHLGAVFGIYKITEQNWAVAFLYGVHPLHSEMLGWASALPDVICSVLVVWTIYALNQDRFWSASLLFLIALFSKESAVLLLFCAIVLNKRSFVYLSFTLVLYGLMRIGATQSIGSANIFTFEVLQGLLWSYSSLVLPFPLTAVREVHVTPFWAVPVGMLVLIAAIWIARLRGAQERIGVILLMGGPLIAVPTIASSHMAAERYLCLSILGVSLLFGSLKIDFIRAWRLVLLMMIAVFPLHVSRGMAWQSSSAIFTSAVEVLPNSTYSWYLLGRACLEEQSYKEASKAFYKSLELPNSYPDSDVYLLESLVLDGQFQEALNVVEKGPKQGLTAQKIAWWARALAGVGEQKRALELFLMLRQEEGYDGPEWVEGWVKKLQNAEKN